MVLAGDGQRVWPDSTWEDNWNNVVRRVLFKDTMLLDMMMVPAADRTNALAFINRYFVRGTMTDALVINENVRVVYSDIEGVPMNIPQVRRR